MVWQALKMTSAIGISTITLTDDSSSRRNGFTLLELMLVLLIIGLAVSTVSFSAFSNSAAERLQQQVQQLKLNIEMASEFAVLNQLTLGIRLDEKRQSYRFMIYGADGQWEEILEPKIFDPIALAGDPMIELTLQDLEWQDSDGLGFGQLVDDELSVSSDEVSIGDEDEEKPKPPQILLLPTGEITPFEWELAWFAGDVVTQDVQFLLSASELPPIELTSSLEP